MLSVLAIAESSISQAKIARVEFWKWSIMIKSGNDSWHKMIGNKMTQSVQNIQVDESQIESIVTDKNLNVSQKIRMLDSIKVPRSKIAKILDKRYQHVRNVLTTPLKKST